MTPLDFLDALKEFLQREVAGKLFLQKEETRDQPEFVHPYVECMYLPHQNFAPCGFQVPMILASVDNITNGAEGQTLEARLTLGTYGGGFYALRGEQTRIPDAKGYRDLLNLAELCKQKLIGRRIIGGAGAIGLPVSAGVYDGELIYPYWYGFVQFTAEIPANEYTDEEEDYGI